MMIILNWIFRFLLFLSETCYQEIFFIFPQCIDLWKYAVLRLFYTLFFLLMFGLNIRIQLLSQDKTNFKGKYFVRSYQMTKQKKLISRNQETSPSSNNLCFVSFIKLLAEWPAFLWSFLC